VDLAFRMKTLSPIHRVMRMRLLQRRTRRRVVKYVIEQERKMRRKTQHMSTPLVIKNKSCRCGHNTWIHRDGKRWHCVVPPQSCETFLLIQTAVWPLSLQAATSVGDGVVVHNTMESVSTLRGMHNTDFAAILYL